MKENQNFHPGNCQDYEHPEILKAENNDKFQVTINDDLSDLLHFRMTAGGKTEER